MLTIPHGLENQLIDGSQLGCQPYTPAEFYPKKSSGTQVYITICRPGSGLCPVVHAGDAGAETSGCLTEDLA
jgi:hypothetical protein